jgi:GTP cyclohydrolase FolE2
MQKGSRSNGVPGRTEAARKSSAPMHDKQNERDHRELRIDKVGVRGLRFPIQVRDKARSVQNTIATIGMFVDLPKEFKGTHMSRFIEVLNAHGSVVHVENITDILHAMQRKLNAATAHRDGVSFLTKRRRHGNGKRDGLHGALDATASGQDIDFADGEGDVTTLCPCSKAMVRRTTSAGCARCRSVRAKRWTRRRDIESSPARVVLFAQRQKRPLRPTRTRCSSRTWCAMSPCG